MTQEPECVAAGQQLFQAMILAAISTPCPIGSTLCFPHTWALSPSRFFYLRLSDLIFSPLCLEQRLWGCKSNFAHVGREGRVLAGVMLEIPSEVCVPPAPIRSEPSSEIPFLGWDLDTHCPRSAGGVCRKKPWSGRHLPAFPQGRSRGCPQPALQLPPAPVTAGQATAKGCPPTAGQPGGTRQETLQKKLQKPLKLHLHSVFDRTQDEEFLLSEGLWHFVLLFSLSSQSVLIVGLPLKAGG